MWIKSYGADFTNAIKTPMQYTLGNGASPNGQEGPQHSFQEFLSTVANNAGYQAIIHPDLAKLTRDYWSQMNKSLMQVVARYGDELGALYRVQNGNQLIVTTPAGMVGGIGSQPGFSFSGNATPSTGNIICKWSENLIGYRVRPEAARPSWRGSDQNYYDTQGGSWQTITKDFGIKFAGGPVDNV